MLRAGHLVGRQIKRVQHRRAVSSAAEKIVIAEAHVERRAPHLRFVDAEPSGVRIAGREESLDHISRVQDNVRTETRQDVGNPIARRRVFVSVRHDGEHNVARRLQRLKSSEWRTHGSIS